MLLGRPTKVWRSYVFLTGRLTHIAHIIFTKREIVRKFGLDFRPRVTFKAFWFWNKAHIWNLRVRWNRPVMFSPNSVLSLSPTLRTRSIQWSRMRKCWLCTLGHYTPRNRSSWLASNCNATQLSSFLLSLLLWFLHFSVDWVTVLCYFVFKLRTKHDLFKRHHAAVFLFNRFHK